MLDAYTKIIEFSSTTEGRDKALKVLQYLPKLIKGVWVSKYSINLQYLSSATRNTRKFFRLGKSLNELAHMPTIYRNRALDRSQKALKLLRNTSLVLRWVFDNISILSASNFLLFDEKKYMRLATGFWLLSLVFNLIDCIREIMMSYAREANFKNEALGQSTRWVLKTLDRFSETRRVTILEMARTIGDMVVASNGAEVPYKLLGKNFSEKWVGLGGLIAAIINCYQLWKELPK